MAGQPWLAYQAQPAPQAGGKPWERYAQPQAESPVNTAAKSDMDEYSWRGMANEYANSIGKGMTTGMFKAAGTLGDARELQKNIVEWGAGKAGLTPEQAQTASKALQYANPLTAFAPTTDQIMPQAVAEAPRSPLQGARIAETAAEIFPSVAAAPGSALAKGAQTLIPAAATELAGPYAGMAAALVTGGKGRSVPKIAAKQADSEAAIFKEKADLYKTLEQAGARYDAQEFSALSQGLMSALRHRLDPQLAPNGSVVVRKIAELSGNGYSPSLPEIDEIKKIINEVLPAAAAASNKNDVTVLGFIKQELNNFETNAPLITNGSVSPDAVKPMVDRARELSGRLIKAREVKEMMTNAEGYKSGDESGLQNQFGNLLKSPKRRMWYSEAERSAMKDVQRGSSVGHRALGTIGRAGFDLSKSGNRALALPGLLAAAITDLSTTGGIGTAAKVVGALGGTSAAKMAAEKITERDANRVISTILAGRAAQKQAASLSQKEKRDALIRALLGATAAARAE